jgi:hypothetical protein
MKDEWCVSCINALLSSSKWGFKFFTLSDSVFYLIRCRRTGNPKATHLFHPCAGTKTNVILIKIDNMLLSLLTAVKQLSCHCRWNSGCWTSCQQEHGVIDAANSYHICLNLNLEQTPFLQYCVSYVCAVPLPCRGWLCFQNLAMA